MGLSFNETTTREVVGSNLHVNMASTEQETVVVLPAEVPEGLPVPSDPKVVFLGGLCVLAVLAAAYVAQESPLPNAAGRYWERAQLRA